jgi:hypothetical protein
MLLLKRTKLCQCDWHSCGVYNGLEYKYKTLLEVFFDSSVIAVDTSPIPNMASQNYDNNGIMWRRDLPINMVAQPPAVSNTEPDPSCFYCTSRLDHAPACFCGQGARHHHLRSGTVGCPHMPAPWLRMPGHDMPTVQPAHGGTPSFTRARSPPLALHPAGANQPGESRRVRERMAAATFQTGTVREIPETRSEFVPPASTADEEDFTCSVCISTVFEPVLLVPCGHMYCGAHAKNWFRAQTTNNTNDPNAWNASSANRVVGCYTCANCRGVVRGVRIDLALNQRVEAFERRNPNEARTEEERRELRQLYRPGEDIVPRLTNPPQPPLPQPEAPRGNRNSRRSQRLDQEDDGWDPYIIDERRRQAGRALARGNAWRDPPMIGQFGAEPPSLGSAAFQAQSQPTQPVAHGACVLCTRNISPQCFCAGQQAGPHHHHQGHNFNCPHVHVVPLSRDALTRANNPPGNNPLSPWAQPIDPTGWNALFARHEAEQRALASIESRAGFAPPAQAPPTQTRQGPHSGLRRGEEQGREVQGRFGSFTQNPDQRNR